MKSIIFMIVSATLIACCIKTTLYCEEIFTTLYDDAVLSRDDSKFDYSSFTWVEAFDSLHACLSLRYPFTEWKAIDWEQKRLEMLPKIIEAQDAQDNVRYIQNLFEYLYDVPDGHINLIGEIDPFKQSKLAGCYGFNMMPISDESVVVSLVIEGSPAYDNGLRTGDRILSWNGVDIHSVPRKELWNYFRNYATREGRLLSRYTMLSRDAIGAQAAVTFQSYETGSEETMILDAFEDEFELFIAAVFNTTSPLFMDSFVEYHIMQSENGYLRISAEDSEGDDSRGDHGE